jgi:hypothetical protein
MKKPNLVSLIFIKVISYFKTNLHHMKYLLYLAFLLLIGCKNSTDKNEIIRNQVVTDKDIYEIVNFVVREQDSLLRKDGIKNNPYKYIIDRDAEPLLDKRDSVCIHKLDTIFSKEDLIFINAQIQNRKNFKFTGKFINSKKVLYREVLDSIMKESAKTNYQKHPRKIYEEIFGSDMFYTIGLPVFSKDKNTVLVKFGGDGSGFIAVYKRINNRWKFCYYVTNWIA